MSSASAAATTFVERLSGDQLRLAANRRLKYDGVQYEAGELLPADVPGHIAESLVRALFATRVLPVDRGNLREVRPGEGEGDAAAAMSGSDAETVEDPALGAAPPAAPDSRQPEPSAEDAATRPKGRGRS